MTEPDNYAGSVEGLDELGQRLCTMIEGWLRHHQIPFHSVSFRVKGAKSASDKVAGDEKYTGYSDLTDLLGVRIITYFADDVDRVSDAIVPELSIDEENSVDKRAVLDPDRFGYLSLHYIATLADERGKLLENVRFAGTRFELQIRSILQHAWAEIEHDLGYKSKSAIPRELRRRFSRVAGLLEVADEEFKAIRRDAGEIDRREAREMSSAPAGVRISQTSIRKIISTDALVHRIDKAIAREARSLLIMPGGTYADARARDLADLGVADVRSLRRELERREVQVSEFARVWLSEGRHTAGPMPHGVSLFYLIYVLAAEQRVVPTTFESLDESQHSDLLSRMTATLDAIAEEPGSTP